MQKVQREKKMSLHQFMCGPFLSASYAITQFGENMYQMNLLNEAVDIYNDYQIKINEAISNSDDEEYIMSLQKESDYYDQIFQISIGAGITLYEA
jgi:hypothetical protein